VNSLLCESGANLFARGWSDAAAIANNGVFARGFDQTICAERDLTHHRRVAHAQKDVVGSLGDFARRAARRSLPEFRHLLRFPARVRPQRDFVSGFEKMARHAIAHDAESEKSDLCQRLPPDVSIDFNKSCGARILAQEPLDTRATCLTSDHLHFAVAL